MRIGTKLEDGFVNLDTGEYNEIGEVYRYELVDDHERKKKFAIKAADSQYREEAIQRYLETRKDYGNFIWGIYEVTTELHPEVSPSNLTKLIYLATYLSFDGSLRWGKAHGHRPITKKDCETILYVSPRTFDAFWKEMIDNDILAEDPLSNGILMNPSYFAKGKIDVTVEFGAEYTKTRIFVDGVRALYTKTDTRYHKSLSLIYRIMPFVNRMYNIVCKNPFETDINKVEPLSLKEIGSFLGYDEKNLNRLTKTIYEIKFFADGKEQTAVRYVTADRKRYEMYINPLVYYGGPNRSEVQILSGFIKEEK